MARVFPVNRPRLTFLCFCVLLPLLSCEKNEEVTIIPPADMPLTRTELGWGIVTPSYLHLLDSPQQGEAADENAPVSPLPESGGPGFLRGGAVVKVLERRALVHDAQENGASAAVWLRIASLAGEEDGAAKEGWAPESAIRVFDNEAKAKTESEVFRQ
jgi:hypothetical protein